MKTIKTLSVMESLALALSKKDYFQSTKELKTFARLNPISHITPYLDRFETLHLLKTRYEGRRKEIYDIKKERIKKLFVV